MATMRAQIVEEMTVSPMVNFVSLESMSSFVKATSPAPPNPTPMDMMREEINGKLERITTPKTFLG